MRPSIRIELAASIACVLLFACSSDETPREAPATETTTGVTSGREAAEPAPVVESTRVEPASASSRLDPFESAILDAHDRARANVSPAPRVPLPRLEWDERLAALARDWAARCPEGHRPDVEHGENLYWSSGRELEPSAAVESWAREAQYYDYATGRCVKNGRASWSACGHYTQLVWRDTTRVGCARRTDCDGDFENVVVCYYDPPGNVNVTATTIPRPY